jgi:hypothetical protein
MRARCQPEQESIPIPIPTPTPIQTMIWLIGNHCLVATHDGTRLFGQPLARARPKTLLVNNKRSPDPNGKFWLGQPRPFRTGSGEECLATEVTENTEDSHLKHPG